MCVLPLEHGFETDQLAVISEQDILGDRLARPRRKRKAANIIMEASALSPGDLVVHIDHGVARYSGLMTLDVQAPRMTAWSCIMLAATSYSYRSKTLNWCRATDRKMPAPS